MDRANRKPQMFVRQAVALMRLTTTLMLIIASKGLQNEADESILWRRGAPIRIRVYC